MLKSEKTHNSKAMKDRKYEELGNRPDFATPAQLRKIEGLWRDITQHRNERDMERTLRAFLCKRFNILDLRFLERSKVSKVIHSLECIWMQKIQNAFNSSHSDCKNMKNGINGQRRN